MSVSLLNGRCWLHDAHHAGARYIVIPGQGADRFAGGVPLHHDRALLVASEGWMAQSLALCLCARQAGLTALDSSGMYVISGSAKQRGPPHAHEE